MWLSHSRKSGASDVKVIPNERLERARAKKYGIPYDPEHTAWIKSYVKWKNSNDRKQLAAARERKPRKAAPSGVAEISDSSPASRIDTVSQVYVNVGGFEVREVDEAQDVINEEMDSE